MPWKSDQQRKWGNSPSGKKSMGEEKVNEFNEASKGMKLPKKSLSTLPSHIHRVTTK